MNVMVYDCRLQAHETITLLQCAFALDTKEQYCTASFQYYYRFQSIIDTIVPFMICIQDLNAMNCSKIRILFKFSTLVRKIMEWVVVV